MAKKFLSLPRWQRVGIALVIAIAGSLLIDTQGWCTVGPPGTCGAVLVIVALSVSNYPEIRREVKDGGPKD